MCLYSKKKNKKYPPFDICPGSVSRRWCSPATPHSWWRRFATSNFLSDSQHKISLFKKISFITTSTMSFAAERRKFSSITTPENIKWRELMKSKITTRCVYSWERLWINSKVQSLTKSRGSGFASSILNHPTNGSPWLMPSRRWSSLSTYQWTERTT